MRVRDARVHDHPVPRAARAPGCIGYGSRPAILAGGPVCDDGRMTSAPTSTAGRLGAVSPTREEFRALAVGHRVIPVVRRVLADDETPVGVYRKLAGDRPGTFLFESAENGRSWSRWSFVGVRCAAALTEVDGALCWTGDVPAGLPTAGDPLAALAGRRRGAAQRAAARTAAVDRRPGRLPRLRRRAPAGAAAHARRGRPAPPRAGDAAGHRPGRASTTTRAPSR